MDRATTQAHLTQVEEHVAAGERSLARQREVIAQLERGGHDTQEARKLLAQFEDLQGMHMADRDRLREQLARMVSP